VQTKDENTFAAWVHRVAWGLIAGFASLMIAVISWLVIQVAETPSYAQMQDMIISEGPYLRDKSKIFSDISHAQKASEKLSAVVERNTDALNNIRIELALLREWRSTQSIVPR
jgi:hypothetical protein